MTLETLFDRTEGRTKRFVVYTSEERRAVADRFEAENAAVEHRSLPGGDEGFVVVRGDAGFLGAIPLKELRALLDPPIVRPWELVDIGEGHRAVFDLLDDTVFTSLDRRQLLAAAREVEEYAWRVGAGTLHASFQSAEAFDEQRRIYERLAGDTDLDVRVYTEPVPDDAPEGIAFRNHLTEAADRFWIVAFDGCGDDARKCALVARQQGPAEYDGFWTYDPETVDAVLATIEAVETG